DWTVNGRSLRTDAGLNSNHNEWPAMAPHGIYPCEGDDEWVAIACRDDTDWRRLGTAIDQPWCIDPAFADVAGRLASEERPDESVGEWTPRHHQFHVQHTL